MNDDHGHWMKFFRAHRDEILMEMCSSKLIWTVCKYIPGSGGIKTELLYTAATWVGEHWPGKSWTWRWSIHMSMLEPFSSPHGVVQSPAQSTWMLPQWAHERFWNMSRKPFVGSYGKFARVSYRLSRILGRLCMASSRATQAHIQ